eukprot:m.9254 g.9254  ORF g.9254 m.9254 type:complete len:95 (-) comp6864_c0_seq1:342-626(-)
MENGFLLCHATLLIFFAAGTNGLKKIDVIASNEKRDAAVKEAVIKVETLKILRENLGACYNREGVNHYDNCKSEAQAYLAAIKDLRASGGEMGL